jgi:cytochrome c-type biogenesis protein CcmE
VAKRDQLGTRRFRLEGVVVPGSVETDATDVRFTVEHACTKVAVFHQGARPELFKPGIPVVLEGAFAAHGDTFRSDRIIVRHTEEYRTDESQNAEAINQEACDQ